MITELSGGSTARVRVLLRYDDVSGGGGPSLGLRGWWDQRALRKVFTSIGSAAFFLSGFIGTWLKCPR